MAQLFPVPVEENEGTGNHVTASLRGAANDRQRRHRYRENKAELDPHSTYCDMSWTCRTERRAVQQVPI